MSDDHPGTAARAGRFRRATTCLARPLAAASLLALSALAANAAALVPHDALYDIRLLSARDGSNIERVSGKMAIRWEAACDGWTMTHRTLFDIGLAEGGAVRLAMDAATWEAVPPTRYTFSVSTRVDGREVERLEGVAHKDGGAPKAVFSAPERTTMDLPGDVMFPTEHTRAVLDAAGEGATAVPARVFDGFSEDGPSIVNALIGRPRAGGGAGEFPALAGRRAWQMSLAFFPLSGDRPEPESEIGVLIFDNGVAKWFDMNFGDFVIRAELRSLKAFPAPRCE